MKNNYKGFLLIALSLVLTLFSLIVAAFTQVVNVQNYTFSPSSFNINLGDTIKWMRINGTHTTTSKTIPAGAVAWDKTLNATSISFTYVPAVVGTYDYKCTPHEFTQNMVAS